MADYEVNKRLKKLIVEVFKTTPFAFSQKYDDNRGVKTSQVIRERNGLSNNLLNQILKSYPQISKNWLLTGQGYPIQQSESLISSHKINYWQDNYASGGELVTYDDIKENARQIIIDLPEFRECTDAINLYGDSMSPRYKSGQIILLKEWKENYIEYGNPYLVITQQGNKMLKVLREVKNRTAQIKCESYNPDYDSFTINKTDIIKLFVVMGAIEKSKI